MMPAFLIVYSRRSGAVSCQEFPSLVEATRERRRLDRQNSDPDREIVAVSSPSEESLKHTHSRYFAVSV
ncbi:hypothetical protein CGLAU_09095 [Corynebacterium glaucum]|uniref:Uncharacterized protein n=1 Tax=Corynebacterium glaucum TaxID=187491 RepID=A0A1Q2HY46_9CORY|nr:hypothetical protein CGLAU_09095 [Corynebacterium glaucum]